MKKVVITLSFLSCVFFANLEGRLYILPPEPPSCGAAIGTAIGGALGAWAGNSMRMAMEEKEQARAYECYLQELRAQEEMMERQRQRELEFQEYLAEMEERHFVEQIRILREEEQRKADAEKHQISHPIAEDLRDEWRIDDKEWIIVDPQDAPQQPSTEDPKEEQVASNDQIDIVRTSSPDRNS